MSVDVKEMRSEIREGAAEAQETMTNAATGAVVSVVEAAADPVGTARKEVRRLAKRGEPVNRRLGREAENTAEDVAGAVDDVVSGNLAERVALRGIKVLRNRARRRDIFGDVLYGGLNLFNTVLDGTARELNKFQDASQPPNRDGDRRRSPARRSTRSRSRSAAARGSARSTAARASGTARRSASRARRSTTRRTS